MRTSPRFRFAILPVLVSCVAMAAQDSQNEKLDRQYQSAVAQYEAGKYSEAAAQLETLLPHAPDSFAIRELMGLAYASLGQDSKALDHLQAAVRIKPDSAEARTNLAATLSHAGKAELAGEQFRKALALEPENLAAQSSP